MVVYPGCVLWWYTQGVYYGGIPGCVTSEMGIPGCVTSERGIPRGVHRVWYTQGCT